MQRSHLFWIALGFVSALSAQQTPTGVSSQTHTLVLRATHQSECGSKSIAPRALPDGRLLLGVVDTVYMIGGNGKVEWKYATRGPEQSLALAAPPAFNASTKEIGVIGCDLFFVRLAATSGKEKWRTRVNGSSEYKQIAPYATGFLLVINSHGSSELEYWGDSGDDFRQVQFPEDAELVVSGEKIYAVRHGNRALRVEQLQPKRPARR